MKHKENNNNNVAAGDFRLFFALSLVEILNALVLSIGSEMQNKNPFDTVKHS